MEARFSRTPEKSGVYKTNKSRGFSSLNSVKLKSKLPK